MYFQLKYFNKSFALKKKEKRKSNLIHNHTRLSKIVIFYICKVENLSKLNLN